MAKFSLTSPRAIDVDVTTATSLDAIKSLVRGIEEMEYKYFKDTSSVADVTATNRVFPSVGNPYSVHVFTMTIDISAGQYTGVLVETVPNNENIS